MTEALRALLDKVKSITHANFVSQTTIDELKKLADEVEKENEGEKDEEK